MEVKKGRDLKRGDVVVDDGLILDVELDSDPDGFWSGNPNYKYLSINDAYYGASYGQLPLDREYKVLTDRKDIVRVIKKIDSELAKYIADMMEQRKDARELYMEVLKKHNGS